MAARLAREEVTGGWMLWLCLLVLTDAGGEGGGLGG